jgi:hypothetical protein
MILHDLVSERVSLTSKKSTGCLKNSHFFAGDFPSVVSSFCNENQLNRAYVKNIFILTPARLNLGQLEVKKMKSNFRFFIAGFVCLLAIPSLAFAKKTTIEFYGNDKKPLFTREIQEGELGWSVMCLTSLALAEAKEQGLIADFQADDDVTEIDTIDGQKFDSSTHDDFFVRKNYIVRGWRVSLNWTKDPPALLGYNVKAGDHLIWFYEKNSGSNAAGGKTVFVPTSPKVQDKLED